MKNIKFIVLLFLILSVQVIYSQDVMTLEPFNEINATGIIEITLQKSDEERLELETRNFDRNDVKVRIENNVLRINVTKSLIKDAVIEITVFYKEIRRIKANAGTQVYANNPIVGDNIDLKANSGAIINLELEVNNLNARLAEGAQMILSGSTEDLSVSASSGAIFYGFKLASNYTYANANTGARAEVVANKSLDAGANTGGKVRFEGDPQDRDFNHYWGGRIEEY